VACYGALRDRRFVIERRGRPVAAREDRRLTNARLVD
jgi:hypothetical protein